MNELTQYMTTANRIRKQLWQPEFNLNVVWHRLALAENLEYDLRPENLSCDSEFAPGSWKTRQRELFLTRAQQQLAFIEEHEMKHAMLMGGEFPIGE